MSQLLWGSRHSPQDGRGRRDVYLDGKLVEMVLEADTAENWVRVQTKTGKVVRCDGRVTVIFK